MRVPKWRESLESVIDDARARAFEWGTHDCCQFVARCAEAISGEDRRGIFPPYASELQAAAILASYGGIGGLLDLAFGERIPIAHAGVGDVVLIDMGAGEQPAICVGVHCLAPGARGLEYRKTLNAVAAWSI